MEEGVAALRGFHAPALGGPVTARAGRVAGSKKTAEVHSPAGREGGGSSDSSVDGFGRRDSSIVLASPILAFGPERSAQGLDPGQGLALQYAEVALARLEAYEEMVAGGQGF